MRVSDLLGALITIVKFFQVLMIKKYFFLT